MGVNNLQSVYSSNNDLDDENENVSLSNSCEGSKFKSINFKEAVIFKSRMENNQEMNRRVLVVDDEPYNVLGLLMMMR